MANIPVFAAGSYDKIQPAIDAGILTYPAYVFVTDKKVMGFIDKNLDILLSEGGSGIGGVERVDELPDPSEANEDTLYIYDNIVYVFTGEDFKPMYEDYTEAIDELTSSVTELEGKVEAIEDAIENITDGSSGLNFESYSDFPEAGLDDQLYIDTSENVIYRWDSETEAYVSLSGTEGTGVIFVELDDELDDETVTASTAEEITEALADENVKTVVLGADIEVAEGENAVIRFTGGEKTIDLNGYNITAPSDEAEGTNVAIYATGGTLTINGTDESYVFGGEGSANNIAVWSAGEDTTVIINGGSYNCGLDVDGESNSTIYASGGGSVVINGGFYKNESDGSTSAVEGYIYVLNIQNNTGSRITCYGGSYLNQDPSKGDDRDTTTGATFVAEGYKVESSDYGDGDTLYTVMEE